MFHQLSIPMLPLSQATDRDTGMHAVVWYELTATGNPFVVQRETGVISTSSTFTELAGTKYVLNVEAFDNQGISPSLRNETIINVSVKIVQS